MGVVVQFDLAAWRAAYPNFSGIADGTVTGVLLPQATTLHRNDGGGPITSMAVQTQALNLVVAHLATIFFQSQGDQAPGQAKDSNTPPGRVSSATEGSVTVQMELGTPGTSAQAYWQQTAYGTMYWQLMAPYRTMRYMPGPRRIMNPWPRFG